MLRSRAVQECRSKTDPLTAATALRAGENDLGAQVPMQQVPILERSPGITVVTGPAMIPTVGFLNLRVKPFHDLRARRAIGGARPNPTQTPRRSDLGRRPTLGCHPAPRAAHATPLPAM